jgi:uncharacterized protein involved in tolerance to divalent cations
MSNLLSCRCLTQYALEIALIRFHAIRNEILNTGYRQLHTYSVKKIIDITVMNGNSTYVSSVMNIDLY